MNDNDWIDHEDPIHRGHYLVQQETTELFSKRLSEVNREASC